MSIKRDPFPESVDKIVRHWVEFDFVVDKIGVNKTLVIEVDVDLAVAEQDSFASFMDCMDAWAKQYVERTEDFMIKTCRVVPVSYRPKYSVGVATPEVPLTVEGLGSM